ncbi:MAG: DUF1573 domain-containing protein [Candidatus Omnitrophota bacterium]
MLSRNIHIQPEIVEFGTLWENDQQTASFTLVNSSSHDLIVEEASADCGCTRINLSQGQQIKPNESAPFDIRLTPSFTHGVEDRRVMIALKDNNGKQIRKQCLIRYRGLGEIRCVPQAVVVPEYPANRPWSKEVALEGVAKEDIDAVTLESSTSTITAEKAGFEIKNGKECCMIKLESSGFKPGALLERLVIHDNRKEKKFAVLPIGGYITEPFVAVPSSLFVDVNQFREEKTQKILIKTKIASSFHIENISTDNGLFICSCPQSDNELEKTIELSPKSSNGNNSRMKDTLHCLLSSKDNNQFNIDVPIIIQ